jgi:hypothetical protein
MRIRTLLILLAIATGALLLWSLSKKRAFAILRGFPSWIDRGSEPFGYRTAIALYVILSLVFLTAALSVSPQP